MLDPKIFNLLKLANGSKQFYHQTIELLFEPNVKQRYFGEIQNLRDARIVAIRAYTEFDIPRTFNENPSATFLDYLCSAYTLVTEQKEEVIKNFPMSMVTVNGLVLNTITMDIPFLQIDWTRSFITRYAAPFYPIPNTPVYFNIGIYYVKNDTYKRYMDMK